MKSFINMVLNAAKKYNVWDYACFKIVMCSLGIIIGTYFSQFFLKYISVMWVIFIIAYVWIMYKTFIKYKG